MNIPSDWMGPALVWGPIFLVAFCAPLRKFLAGAAIGLLGAVVWLGLAIVITAIVGKIGFAATLIIFLLWRILMAISSDPTQQAFRDRPW